MSNKNEQDELTEENLVTTIVISDIKSKENVVVKLHELDNGNVIGVNVNPSVEEPTNYDTVSLMALGCIIKGLEDPTKIFSLEEMMKDMESKMQGMPNFQGPMGEA